MHVCKRQDAHTASASGVTECDTWPEDAHSAGVRCYTADNSPIACCGHGLLSCAALWTRRWGGPGELHMGHSTIPCRAEGSLYWLGFPPVPGTGCAMPSGLSDLLEMPIEDCAAYGGDSDYLVARLAKDTDLHLLPPPGESLAGITGRALIVTCACKERAVDGEQFHFRYFAPQFGVAEDTATGSAMRVLVSYWHGQGITGRQQALQCSPGGGWLSGQLQDARAWVGGHVQEAAA